MKLKLCAGFLCVASLYVAIGEAVPRLGLGEPSTLMLSAALYVGVGVAAAWILSYLLARRLRELSRAATRISQGDLTLRLDATGDDEAGVLARSFGTMSASLLEIVLDVQQTAERINASALSLSASSSEINASTDEIAASAQQIARGVEDQAGQVLRTTDTTKTLSASVERVASRARDVYQSAAAAADRAARGAEEARRATLGIEQLTGSTTSATAAVEGFRSKAGAIGNIVESITSISQQTHLLAINAAIEAARAGSEGRGFAVVAEEVGRLADDVRRFAEQISSISEQIMHGSQQVADEFRKSVAAVEELRQAGERNARSFEEILAGIRSTASRVGEISQLTGGQKDAAIEVARSLERISRVAERNARGSIEASTATGEQTVATQRLADSARQLAATSDHLRNLVAVFKVR